jgi:putative hydrolase of the HAD superfamily
LSSRIFSEVKAVYFDLDDTLCPYWEASKFGLYRAFELFSPEGFSPDEMIHFWAVAFNEFAPSLKQTEWYGKYLVSGNSTRVEQMRRALIHANCGDLDLAQKLADAYAEERDRALMLFDDAKTVLDALYGKMPLGLITNGPADVQRQEIATLGVGQFFDHVFIEGELGFGKPLTEVLRRAEVSVDFRPPEILFVGNSYRQDMQPCIERGWKTAWIRRPTDLPPKAVTPEHKPDNAPAPDVTVGDLRELLPLF